MFNEVSKALRIGVIAGLIILITGIIIEALNPSTNAVKEFGLWLIVSTPPAGLSLMLARFIKRKELVDAALSLLMLVTIITSALLLANK